MSCPGSRYAGLLGLTSLAAVATGCDAKPSEQLPPTVRLVSEILLQETDSLYLARPGQLALSPGGDLLITDQFHQRGLVFDSEGRLTRSIGRKGAGPGEFRMIGEPMFVDDSTVLIFDDGQRKAQLFNWSDGSYRGAIPYSGSPHSARLRGEELWFGALDPNAASLGVRIGLFGGVPERFGDEPEAFRSLPALAGTHGLVSLALWDQRVLVGLSGLDSLLMYDARSKERVLGVRLPAVRRRQMPADLDALRAAFAPPRPPPELWAYSSFLLGMERLSDGNVAVLHMDQVLDGRAIRSRPFISVISDDLTRACVDAPLDVQSDARIASAFVGGQLALVRQVDSAGAVRTLLGRYSIGVEGCEWTAIR